MSRHNIRVPIYGLTTGELASASMTLYRNVRPHADAQGRPRRRAAGRRSSCWWSAVLKPGDTYAITCGEPMGYPGGTNMLKVCRVACPA
jgi:pyruvate kinase